MVGALLYWNVIKKEVLAVRTGLMHGKNVFPVLKSLECFSIASNIKNKVRNCSIIIIIKAKRIKWFPHFEFLFN